MSTTPATALMALTTLRCTQPAHYRCTGTDGQYTASVYSTCSVPAPNPDDFTPYEDLTLNQVLGWIWANGVDKDATEAAVQTQIDNLINPPVVTLPIPWNQS
jgi:hypothetical protein